MLCPSKWPIHTSPVHAFTEVLCEHRLALFKQSMPFRLANIRSKPDDHEQCTRRLCMCVLAFVNLLVSSTGGESQWQRSITFIDCRVYAKR